MLTYERTDDYVLTVSDAGRAKLAEWQHREEAQRDAHNDRQRAEILMWTTAAAVVAIAALAIKSILGV
jgi:hypothetical protein